MLKHFILLQVIVCCFCSLTKLQKETLNWKPPTPAYIQQAQHVCSRRYLADDSAVELTANMAYIKCCVTELGLWTDADGYVAQRVVKMFAKYKQRNEVRIVVDYCNQQHRQTLSLSKWAYDAYKCATAGKIGLWLQALLKSVVKYKPNRAVA